MFVQSSRPLLLRQAFEAIAQALEDTRRSCVQLAHASSGGCGPIPRAFVFRHYRLRSPSPDVAFIPFEIPTIAW